MHLVLLGRVSWCVAAGVLCGALALAPRCYSQTELETQQKANERIRELAKSTHTPPHDYVIGRGDLLIVEVFDVPELSRELRVSQTGTIGLPLVPVRLFMDGLTEAQAQQKIAEVLEANGLVAHPQVMVSVKEKRSKPITIVGAVPHPMVYQADRPITLVELLAEAGGISADAGDTVIITRAAIADTGASAEPPEIVPENVAPAANPSPPASGTAQAAPPAPQAATSGSNETPSSATPVFPDAQSTLQKNSAQSAEHAAVPPEISDPAVPPANTITVNLAELLEKGETENNLALQAGDLITVPHAGIIYALGAVQHPGGFVANNDRAQLSTLKLLALAGGTTRIAKKSNAVIIRKDSQGRQIAVPVDLAKIVKRETEDVRLLPSDILYVPDNNTKATLLRVSEIALAVGSALVIYRVGTR